jgi:hypothetical protein
MRLKAFSFATRCLQKYSLQKCTVDGIVDLAVSSGFFSVWYQVFQSYPAVIRALIGLPEFFLEPTWFDVDGKPCAPSVLDPDDY